MARLPGLPRAALCALLALCARAACAEPPSAHPVLPRQTADARFAQLEHEYVTYVLGAYPVVATYLGGAAFDASLAGVDGRLRDDTPEALAREDARLGEFRARFAALAPAKLSPRRRIDRSVALAQIAFLLHAHEVRRLPLKAVDAYVVEPVQGIDWQLQAMTPTGATTLGTEAQWRAVVARVRAVPAYLATAQQQLAAGVAAQVTPDWRLLTEFGLRTSAANAEYFAATLPQLAAANLTGGARDAVLRDLQAAGNEAAAAYRALREFVARTFFAQAADPDDAVPLEADRADRYAIGAAEYDWALRNNLRVTESAATLYAASAPAIEATRSRLIALARQVAAAHKWTAGADGAETVRAVYAQLGQSAPHTDADMLEGYRRAATRLVGYGRASGLFAVPADYRLDIEFTPAPLRAAISGAAYYPAPPLKGTGTGRFYVTPTDDDAAELRAQHNYAAMPDLAAHEGFPGHDWDYYVMTRSRGEISPLRWLTPGAVEDSTAMWQDSMSVEGWALYAEGLPAEPQPGSPQGFYSPEERLYVLRGALLRELRVRLDTGLHTGRLAFEDAVTELSAGMDFLPGSCEDEQALKLEAKQASCDAARREILRYARWPTQAITYRLGRDAILALRRRAQRLLGARFSAQRFHLEFMKQGTIAPGYFGDELLHVLGAASP